MKKRGRPTKPTPEEIAQVRAMSVQGCSEKAIAEHLGRPQPTISRWRERYRIGVTPRPHTPPPRTTEIVPTSLTTPEIARAKTLRAAGWSYGTIGRELGRNGNTIRRLCEEPHIAEEIAALKEDMADLFEGLSRRTIESISDDDIRKINAYQRIVAAAVSVDKMRLLRGESTENISIHQLVTTLDQEYRRQREQRDGQKEEPAPIPGD